MKETRPSNFVFTDEVLHDHPFADIRRASQALLTAKHPGLFLRVPEQVNLVSQQSLPAMISFVTDRSDAYIQRYMDRLVVVATDLYTGTVWAKPAFIVDATNEPLAPNRRRKGSGQAIHIGRVDLRTVLGLPWMPSRLAIHLVLMDRVSEPVFVHLQPPESTFAAQSTSHVVAYKRSLPSDVSQIYSRDVDRQQHPQSPQIPSTKGIELRAPRMITGSEVEHCLLFGSYQLPLYPWNVFSVDSTGNSVAPFGVVPINLLIVGSEDMVPYVYPLRVVVQYVLDPPTGSVANDPPTKLGCGFFGVDLMHALRRLPNSQQTFAIYAISSGIITKPTLVTATVSTESGVGT